MLALMAKATAVWFRYVSVIIQQLYLLRVKYA